MRALAALLTLWTGAAAASCPAPGAPYPAFYPESFLFDRALARTDGVAPWPAPVGATIVPHHLEAAHLIAGGLRQAVGDHDRLLLLFPDHFFRQTAPFATSPHGFDTVLGHVPTDPDTVAALMAAPEGLIEDSCLFNRDHGIRAILPFLADLMPGVPVVPLSVAVPSRPEHWAAMLAHLEDVLPPRTLILQSVDYSHYLLHHEARLRDQQVLNLMAAGDLDAMTRLIQPDHIDSIGSHWIVASLMAGQGRTPVVVASENMQEYHRPVVAETTSYIVAHYTAPDAPSGPPLHPDATVHVLGGDLFTGRSLVRLLADDLIGDAVAAAALEVTQGRPLVVNLEGVLLPDLPAGLGPLQLAMPTALTLDWLARLNVAGVGLANNHAMDFGAQGLAETRAALDAAAIPHAAQGERMDLAGGAVLVALSDLSATEAPGNAMLTDRLLVTLIEADATRPVVAFVHWGREYDPRLGPREKALAAGMAARGVAAIVGAHPHVASPVPVALPGGDAVVIPSLGNFLFDQGADVAPTAAVVELWTFPQGTVFLRQRPLPNLFDIARTVRRTEAAGLRRAAPPAAPRPPATALP